MNKPNQKPKRKPQVRRNMTVASQLQGKLGPQGYGRLLDQLARLTKRAA
jgi:hypothetical protein